MATLNWRTINIDALDPDSPANFDLSSLTPAITPISTADVQTLAGQIRQLLRGGDNEGALQGALENPPYGADERGKVSTTKSCLPSISPVPITQPTPLGRYWMSLGVGPPLVHRRIRLLRFWTPRELELPGCYGVRHLRENGADFWFDRSIGDSSCDCH
jgi:hypothetical protein